MKIKLVVSPAERTMIVSALMQYGSAELATRLGQAAEYDPADDGPEVELLNFRQTVLDQMFSKPTFEENHEVA